jgi:hypothetical protein
VSGDVLREPLVGWRIWRVTGSVLRATVWDAEWPPRARFEADCRHGGGAYWQRKHEPADERHRPPEPGCECGVYAFKRREDAEALAREKVDGDVIALGRVSLWGRVIETELGYRAEYAHPYDLILLGGSDELARRLRREYAVDVSTAPAVAPLHAGGG